MSKRKVRVNGSCDESPSHLEVRYWWTLRHLERDSRAIIMVTSCNSGASYLNRVKLQNGCLALHVAYATLFIPSMMHESCHAESGQVDQEVLKRNLDSAIDVYLERVDGAPCASTQIHLSKGAESTSERYESELLNIFLKGSKEAKKKLKADHHDMYEKFKGVWTVSENHFVYFCQDCEGVCSGHYLKPDKL